MLYVRDRSLLCRSHVQIAFNIVVIICQRSIDNNVLYATIQLTSVAIYLDNWIYHLPASLFYTSQQTNKHIHLNEQINNWNNSSAYLNKSFDGVIKVERYLFKINCMCVWACECRWVYFVIRQQMIAGRNVGGKRFAWCQTIEGNFSLPSVWNERTTTKTIKLATKRRRNRFIVR